MSFILDIPPIQCNPQQNGIREEVGQIQNQSIRHLYIFYTRLTFHPMQRHRMKSMSNIKLL